MQFNSFVWLVDWLVGLSFETQGFKYTEKQAECSAFVSHDHNFLMVKKNKNKKNQKENKRNKLGASWTAEQGGQENGHP